MPARIRALHIAAGNLYGGVETFLVTLARYRDRVPDIASEFALCFEGRLMRELRKQSAAVHHLGNVQLRDPLAVFRANLALLQVTKQNAYDVVITHGAWPHVLFGAQLKLRGIPLVTWAHGAPLDASLLDRLADWIRPDLVIVNSHHTKVALGPLSRGVPSQVIYYPVDAAPAGRARADVRHELETMEGTRVIAFAGRFERWKGHELLLRAAHAMLAQDSGDWCIWMCGGVQRDSERAYETELKTYATNHGLASRVKFLGLRADVPDVLRAADVFCQPNTGPEPFGIVFIEALYASLPIVSTDMGGAAEIVTADCGILTEPEPASVADALRRLLGDAQLRRALASNAPARARVLCEPEARIADIATALRTVSCTASSG